MIRTLRVVLQVHPVRSQRQPEERGQLRAVPPGAARLRTVPPGGRDAVPQPVASRRDRVRRPLPPPRSGHSGATDTWFTNVKNSSSVHLSETRPVISVTRPHLIRGILIGQICEYVVKGWSDIVVASTDGKKHIYIFNSHGFPAIRIILLDRTFTVLYEVFEPRPLPFSEWLIHQRACAVLTDIKGFPPGSCTQSSMNVN